MPGDERASSTRPQRISPRIGSSPVNCRTMLTTSGDVDERVTSAPNAAGTRALGAAVRATMRESVPSRSTRGRARVERPRGVGADLQRTVMSAQVAACGSTSRGVRLACRSRAIRDRHVGRRRPLGDGPAPRARTRRSARVSTRWSSALDTAAPCRASSTPSAREPAGRARRAGRAPPSPAIRSNASARDQAGIAPGSRGRVEERHDRDAVLPARVEEAGHGGAAPRRGRGRSCPSRRAAHHRAREHRA